MRCVAQIACTLSKDVDHTYFDSLEDAQEFNQLYEARKNGGAFGDSLTEKENARINELLDRSEALSPFTDHNAVPSGDVFDVYDPDSEEFQKLEVLGDAMLFAYHIDGKEELESTLEGYDTKAILQICDEMARNMLDTDSPSISVMKYTARGHWNPKVYNDDGEVTNEDNHNMSYADDIVPQLGYSLLKQHGYDVEGYLAHGNPVSVLVDTKEGRSPARRAALKQAANETPRET